MEALICTRVIETVEAEGQGFATWMYRPDPGDRDSEADKASSVT